MSHFLRNSGCSGAPGMRTHLPTQLPLAFFSHLDLYSQHVLKMRASTYREITNTRTLDRSSSVMSLALLVTTIASFLFGMFSQS
jgi:hypothetical protein